MAADAKSAQDDLAFIRAIIDEPGSGLRTVGAIYMAAGIVYGLHCLIVAMHLSGFFALSDVMMAIVSWTPTVIFLGVCVFYVWKDRSIHIGSGIARRAVNAAFAGAGLANLVLAFVFALAAYRRNDFTLWLFFPVVMAALQGAIWYAVAIIRRRLWMGVVAAGWFLSAIILGLLVPMTTAYLWCLGAVLLLLMALPGHFMQRPEPNSA